MADLDKTPNLNTQDPGVSSDGGPAPQAPVPAPETKKDLPTAHAPTVPLPAKDADAKPTPSPLAPKPPAPAAPPKPSTPPAPKKTEVKKAKPNEVELPGKESPDLAETVPVWPKEEKAAPKPKPPVAPKPKADPAPAPKGAPVLETGPVTKKFQVDWKKFLKIGGIVVGVSVLLLGGYLLVRSMTMPEPILEPRTEIPVEDIVVVPPEPDEFSIDFLEDYYEEVADFVKVLEDDVTFGEVLDLRSNQL